MILENNKTKICLVCNTIKEGRIPIFRAAARSLLVLRVRHEAKMSFQKTSLEYFLKPKGAISSFWNL